MHSVTLTFQKVPEIIVSGQIWSSHVCIVPNVDICAPLQQELEREGGREGERKGGRVLAYYVRG